MPVEHFCTGPGATVLQRGDVLVARAAAASGARTADAYLRLIPRTEMDIAVAGAAVSVTLDAAGVCTRRRVAIGAVAPTALLVEAAAQALVGSRLDDEALSRAAAAASAAARPIDDKRGTAAYRRNVVGVLARRAASSPRRARKNDRGEVTSEDSRPNDHQRRADEVSVRAASQTLLDVLRNGLGLTGTKEGCATGDCGACSVLLDGRLVPSCLVLAPEAQGRTVLTIEGIATGEALHPLQQKFLEHAALQCGVCTPGFIVAAKALLDSEPQSERNETRYWLAGNLCRCTGYDKIVRAVLDAADDMRGKAATHERANLSLHWDAADPA